MEPAILLPAALASGLSPDQLQAILAHELAHIRRFDLMVNLLQRLAEAVLFFHPAVWFVSRLVSIEREVVADDTVLAAGWPRVHYADALVRMAELSSTLRSTRFVEQARPSPHGAHVNPNSNAGFCASSPATIGRYSVLLALAGAVRRGPCSRRTHATLCAGLGAPRLQWSNWQPALSPAPDPPNANGKRDEPRIIIAEHVLLWDEQIVTWDEVVARLRTHP